MQEISNKYWFQDLGLLIQEDKLAEFLPKSGMNYPDKINALVRLSIYVGILLVVFNRNYLYFYIPVVAMSATAVLYWFREVSVRKEKNIADNKKSLELQMANQNSIDNSKQIVKEGMLDGCSMPTEENAFMNFMPYDNRKKSSACPPTKPVKAEIEKDFNKGLYRSIGDIFNRSNGQRQYYTMPNTKSHNDQSGFANWLYNTGPSCKEGCGRQCYQNVKPRQQGSKYKYTN
jgi:hypothetical protein